MTVSVSWVLSLLTVLQPIAPWKATYPKTADAIARQASTFPVFDGNRGEERTAALLVAIARHESSFRIDAGGDCDKTDQKTGLCAPGGIPTSFGLFQIRNSNFAWLGVTKLEMVSEPDVQVIAAIKMIRQSFKACSSKPLVDRLGWYHRGGEGCYESAAGRSMMRTAIRVFLDHPPPEPVTTVTPG